MSYNLNDNVKDSFNFKLSDHTYEMRYPTLEEIEGMREVIKKHGEDDTEKIMDYLYKFITPEKGAPDIKTAMRKQNVKVMRNFTKMLEAEFGG